MNFDNGTWWLAVLIIGAVTTSLTYLIKVALFSRLEKTEKGLDELEKSTVSNNHHQKDMDDVRNDIEIIKTNYTTKNVHAKDFDEVREDIKKMKENYITREDFFREQLKTDKKLDKIMDILLAINKEGRIGDK